ncbi:B-cell scaffold protein with ankyrin repeats-like isoform X2 [Brienomyrus brachyistius]|uniref:B-cell scaffold protein with ankyrin repeats-like isoform X2 n=1 Tax=Brienomyrus brachyistius TaxID=42636 RepID=UPI0020B3DF6D|nr:B-cell scaffold protein with ankyrin repeats-like isoform X2 [Brienomyrus brachyistius]
MLRVAGEKQRREKITAQQRRGKMSVTEGDLLIIYETEAEEWASYLGSIFTGSIARTSICRYDIATVTSKRDEHLQPGPGDYKCKLLILSRGMLGNLNPARRSFLARMLHPANRVVVLLCGVETPAPLLKAVPLEEGFLQVSSEQDTQDYLAAVTKIIQRAPAAPSGSPVDLDPGLVTAQSADLKPSQQRRQSTGGLLPNIAVKVVPSRVPCQNPGVVSVLLKDTESTPDMEVEFQQGATVRVKPVTWNKHTLQVKAPDFPAGAVTLGVRSGGVLLGAKVQLQYYSPMEEVAQLLKKAADPVEFMFQAFQTSSMEKVDQILTSSLTRRLPAGGFQGLQSTSGSRREATDSAHLPTLLHFAAQNGLRGLASVLLQCPGVEQALRLANQHGDTPLKLAQKHGHGQLGALLQEALAGSSMEEDNSVYEMMGSSGHHSTNDDREEGGEEGNKQDGKEEEDPYALFGGVDEEYDTILASNKPVIIANRPPAPTPRPDTMPSKEDNTPFIAQVFQKKMSQGTMDTLYSLPSKQARGRDMSSTYDTFTPYQPPGLEELIELQEQVKKGTLTVDEALERFSDWQQVQRGLDDIQQEKLRQLRASIINNREDDENVYDKINIIHHTPGEASAGDRGQHVDMGFYSKPIKGQQSNFLWKADKR